MSDRYDEWKPVRERMYIMECLDDEGFFLHGAALIWPELRVMDGRLYFWYMLNREHLFECRVEEKTEDTLRVACTDNSIHRNHRFLIRPMREEDLDSVKERCMRRPDQTPFTLGECYTMFVKGLDP